MGYNTEFSGQFKITPRLDGEVFTKLDDFLDNPDAGPNSSCDWQFIQRKDHTLME